MSPGGVSVQHLSHSYRGHSALTDLSFWLPPGKILGLIGSNGAGKTTTMKSIAGLIRPTTGDIEVDGFNCIEQPIEFRAHVAYLQDEPQLFPEMTVADHMKFFASAFQMTFNKKAMLNLLGEWDLSEKVHTPAGSLSRGMKQKLAICCAWQRRPRLIMLDEPFTGLDPQGIWQLKDSLKTRAAEGACVIVSSHLLAVVEDLCTHLLMLQNGSSCYFGSVDALKMMHAHDGNGLEEIFQKHVFQQSLHSNASISGVQS